MGDGGERVRDPDSSAQAEEDMAVKVKYDLKMVLLGDENISERCGDCCPGLIWPLSMVRSSSEEIQAKSGYDFICLLRMSQ